MGLVAKDFTFTSGNVIVASEHNANFDTLFNLVNGSISNANINASAAIVSTKLASPSAYFTICITKDGQYTSTVDPVATFQMPFAATLAEVSATARDLDVAGTNAYTVDVKEAGTSVLTSAIALTADNTPVVGAVSDATLADNAKIEIVLTLSGDSTPTVDDLTVLLVFKVNHTS